MYNSVQKQHLEEKFVLMTLQDRLNHQNMLNMRKEQSLNLVEVFNKIGKKK